MATKADELVRLVMEELGVEGPTALARELGMTDYGAPRKIRDWLDDKFSPNYEATALMLERAGLLDLEAGRRRRALADPCPLSPRQEYLVKAAAEGCPPDALAVIFNVSEDEANAELQAAQDELADWQETPGEEQTPGEEETEPADRQPSPEEPDPAKASAEDLQQQKEALRKAVFKLTGQALPEDFNPENVPYLTMILTVKADLEKRVKSLEQTVHPTKPETE